MNKFTNHLPYIYFGAHAYRGYEQGMTSRNYLIFLVIYRVLLQHEWIRAGVMYGNLTHDTVLAFISQICVLVQQTDQGVYYSTKISLLVLVKLAWRVFQK